MFRILLTALMTLCALTSCQSYQPRPLDDQSVLSEWRERRPDAPSVRAFADHLAEAGAWTGTFDLSDGITLDEAAIIALHFSPRLRQARAESSVALARWEESGRWDDPVLSGDLMRITDGGSHPWLSGGALEFTIPLSGRLSVEKALARTEHRAALLAALEAEQTLLFELRSAWTEWSAIRLERSAVDEQIERLQVLIGFTERIAETGEIGRIEVRAVRMEAAMQEHERIVLSMREREMTLTIAALMGLRPSEDLHLVPGLTIDAPPFTDEWESELARRSVSVARSRAAYDTAEESLHLEIRRQYPDLSFGPAYANEDGQSRIGFGFGLPIPILNANRQGIAVARRERDAARAAFEHALEQSVSDAAAAHASLSGLTDARRLLEETLIPLAEAQLEDERQLIELGELNMLLTLDSIARMHDIRRRLIHARRDEAVAAALLISLLGTPDLSTMTEDVR